MEGHVLHDDLYTSPLMSGLMKRLTSSIEIQSTNEINLNSGDRRVLDGLKKRPEAVKKWRKAKDAVIAVHRLRSLVEQKEQAINEQLAKELAEEILSETLSSGANLPSADQISQALHQVNLAVTLSDETIIAPPPTEWGMIVNLLRRDPKRSRWTRMTSELSSNISHVLAPMISTRESVLQQTIESTGSVSLGLHNTINKTHDGLTKGLKRVHARMIQCFERLPRDQETVEAKKTIHRLFENIHSHLKTLVAGKEKSSKELDEIKESLADRKLLAARDGLESYASSISTVVLTHLVPKGSEFIPVLDVIDDFPNTENSPSDVLPPLQTPSSSSGSELDSTFAESRR